jgi:hypothetical protein
LRHKRIISISLAILGVFIFTYLASGFTAPVLVIDHKTRNVDPPPQISNNRTMVPIRFIVEDDAIKGEIFWNAKLGKVAMNCQGKYIELFLGSNKAMVDGKVLYLDAAPYIFAGRTYVPLRFIAEAMGAKVEWKPATQEVAIDFSKKSNIDPGQEAVQPKTVFAYYYYRCFDELKANSHLFTHIAFRWFETDGQGRLFYEYQDDYDSILRYTREKGIKNHASVVLMDKAQLHQLLSSPKNRANLIGNILDIVKKKNYDGVDIDFEFIDPADGPYFTLFLQELKTSLGSDKQLSAAVFARTAADKWATPYEYKKIGEVVDFLVVMAYDHSYKTSAPGPVAPLWWVEQVVDYMKANIPRAKILLGMPTYGYDWANGIKTSTVTAERLAKLKQTYQLNESFDQKSCSPFFSYYDSNGRLHQIWMENHTSLKAKYNLAANNQLGGISFWRIGNGFTDLYRILEEEQK